MTASQIAKRHFQNAVAEGAAQAIEADTIARNMLSLAISTFLQKRSAEDVARELLAASENVDPDADFVFMRP